MAITKVPQSNGEPAAGVAREWIAPKLVVLNAGATAGGANPTTTEGTGGPGGGYHPS